MRTLVTTAALAVCTATLAGPFSAPDAASLTTADDTATSTPIKHLVVVFQENASFDHYFGTYPNAANPPGDPPFVARPDTPTVNNLLPSPLNGNRNLLITNPNQAKPFRLDRAQFVTCSQEHGYRPEQRATNGGPMNRFVQQTDNSGCAGLPRPVPSPQVMGYFDGNTVTALWNYAQHFALNDSAFGTTYGPSTPGALNLVAGRTSGASPGESKFVTKGVVYGDAEPAHDICSDPDKGLAALSGPNVGDLLTQAGVSWGWFQGGFALDPANDPELACEATHRNLAGKDEVNYEPHHNPFQYFGSTANEDHLRPSSVAAIGHDDQAQHQYDLGDFWTAADSGNLPGVSFLKAPGYQDGHPGPMNSNPLDEQDFLVSTLNHLQRLPEWSSTAVVLAWDDSDGWYDHQFPPNPHHSGNADKDGLYGTTPGTLCLAPAGQPAPDPAKIFEMRCGYGERLPLLVVSPYARENVVDHTVIDQASILQFIEDNWGLGRLGNASFDSDAGSMLNMFDFDDQRDDTLILNHFTGNPDRPPSIDPIGITPSEPATDDTVTVSVNASDPDGDPTNPDRQDNVGLTYAWFNGATRLPETGPSLDLGMPGNGDPRGQRSRSRSRARTISGPPRPGRPRSRSSTALRRSASARARRRSLQRPARADRRDHLRPGRRRRLRRCGRPAGGARRLADGGRSLGGRRCRPGTRRRVRRVGARLGRDPHGRDAVADRGPARESSRSATPETCCSRRVLPPTTTAPVSSSSTRHSGGRRPPGGPDPGRRAVRPVRTREHHRHSRRDVPPPHRRPTATPSSDIGSLVTGTWTVVVSTDPSAGYFEAPASDVVPVTVYAPTTGTFVTGGGWVHDPGYLDRPVPISTDDQGTFGLEARLRKDGTPSGNVTYVFAGREGQPVHRPVHGMAGRRARHLRQPRDDRGHLRCDRAGSGRQRRVGHFGRLVPPRRQRRPPVRHVRTERPHARRDALPPGGYRRLSRSRLGGGQVVVHR